MLNLLLQGGVAAAARAGGICGTGGRAATRQPHAATAVEVRSGNDGGG